ncbi:hypothetical protein FS837_002067 [Tulasnella sp. UAMH 9824]|nr:hypothetical protein FS837_002067 [Tulasnella sp. UAMH 9824]
MDGAVENELFLDHPAYPHAASPQSTHLPIGGAMQAKSPRRLEFPATVNETMSSDRSRGSDALEATFSELAHLLIKPARLTPEGERASLGAGGYGEVHLATLDKSSKSKRKVAVKQLRELKVWAKVKHPNTLELIGYYLVSKDYMTAHFVSAYMVNGNVMQYIRRVHVWVAIRLKFARDIAVGLTYLHELSPPICHGDLKPANVLVNDSLDAVICDFGVSSFIQESKPSLWSHNFKHTLESDVWAWGCTVFEILTEKVPYSTSIRDYAIIREMDKKSAPGSIDVLNNMILGTDVDPACLTGMSSLRSIIPQCWDFEPTQRPRSSEISDQITIPSEMKAHSGAWEEQEGGASSLRIGDDSRHDGSASQTDAAPYRTHPLCMNCQQYPKVGGQDFCSKACHDDASPRLSANAQRNTSTQRSYRPPFVKRVSHPNAKRPEISNPYNPVHLTHVAFDPSTGESTSLPKELELIFQQNGIARQDKETDPQAVAETVKFYQETASPRGKTADKDMATSPTTSDDCDLGEGLKNKSQAKHGCAGQSAPSKGKPKEDEGDDGRCNRPIQYTGPGGVRRFTSFGQQQPGFFRKLFSKGKSRPHGTGAGGSSLGQQPPRSVMSSPNITTSAALHPPETLGQAPPPPLPSAIQIRPRLELDERRGGLSSASGQRSERLNALDCAGQLKSRTKPKFTGSFSDVSQAKLGDRVVAVKALRVANTEDGENRKWKWLAREIYVWAELGHPKVLELLGFAIEDGTPCLISPWCDNGTLEVYLRKFPDANRQRLVCEIAEGLWYLHSQTPPIIHGDLTPTNVFVAGDYVAKISDFGTSRRVGELGTGFTTASLVLTAIRYSAPEVLQDGQHPTLYSDVFSFACVALETMTDKCPFWKIPQVVQVINQVVFQKQTPSPEDHPGMGEAIWELLQECWNYEPSDRPKMIDVCQTLAGAEYVLRTGFDPPRARPPRRAVATF